MSTKVNIADEFQKCLDDPIYFIKNYCYVQHQKHGSILMRDFMYDKQEQLLLMVINNQFVIVNKTRQCGASTVLGLYVLWLALFHTNKAACVISIGDKQSMSFKRRYIEYPMKKLPAWMVQGSTKERLKSNMHQTEFYTGSMISCESGPNAGRSEAYSITILDEAGFYESAAETWSAIYPTLSTGGGHAVVNSTSSAMGTWYATQWYNCINKLDDTFQSFILEWSDVPYFKIDPYFLDKARKAMQPESLFRREILREFIVDGEHYFPQKYIDAIQIEEPLRSDFIRAEDKPVDVDEELSLPEAGVHDDRNYYKGLWIWAEPERKHAYVIACDVAEGAGTDYSTIEVIDTTTMEQVAEYKWKIDTFSFAKMIHKIAVYYNEAFVAVEYNSMGNAVFNKLHQDLKYENLYWRPDGKASQKPGWHTTLANRPDILQSTWDVVTNAKVVIRSRRLRDEFQNLVTIKNKVQAALGTNDDLTMAFSIGVHLIADSLIQSAYYDISIEVEKGDDPDDMMSQTPQSMKEYLERTTEYEIDDRDYKQYSWLM